MTRFGRFDDERARVRHLATRHAAAVDQLPRERGLLRASSRTPPVGTPSTGMPGSDDSRGTGTTTSPTDTGGRFLYLRDRRDRRRSGRRRGNRSERTSRSYRCRHGLGLHGHRLPARRASRPRRCTSCPSGADARDLADADHQPPRHGVAALSLFSAVEFCLWDAWDDQTNSSGTSRPARSRSTDGVIYHTTEYRERRNHFAYFACSRGARRLRHAARGPSSVRTAVGIGRRPSSAAVRETRSRTDGRRSARITSSSSLSPGETREVVFVLGYGENRRMRSSTRPARRTIEQAGRPPRDRAIPPRRGGRRRVRPAARALGGDPRGAAGLDAERARRPHGQRLEPVPVHGDVQPVALGLVLRHGDRPRHRLPRLEPGPARVRAHGARARARDGSSTSPRRSFRPAAPTTSTSRSRSEGTTRSARASTTTRSG